MEAKKANNITQ